jgi:class 3 adenylate cyclase
LAEKLVSELGYRRDAEELTRHLNTVFDAIIQSLHRYRGSVIGFSGDAITCWLDADNGLRATACALDMQHRMQALGCITVRSGQTISLAMKAAVAFGPVRRFLVGDPRIQVIDVLAGRTLDYLAEVEHQAEKGEVVLHPSAIQSIRDQLEIATWREHEESGQRVAVVSDLVKPVQAMPWPPCSPQKLSEEQVRLWLLPPVYERLSAGLGRFLAELRPAVALFVQFMGIDYEADDYAGEKLDAFIREVMHIVEYYDGSLIQLTIGDKGSYLYTAFGAPIAHEDDAIRAVSAAPAIGDLGRKNDYLSEIRIGISQGTTRRYHGLLHSGGRYVVKCARKCCRKEKCKCCFGAALPPQNSISLYFLTNLACTRCERSGGGKRVRRGKPVKFEMGTTAGTREVSRSHALLDHERWDNISGFVTIPGGKWTTHRLMAEQTVDLICDKVGTERPCRTHLEPVIEDLFDAG